MDAFERLKRDVDLLGRALGKAIRDFSGEHLYEVEEEVRALTKSLRTGAGEDASARLAEIIGGLDLEEAEGLARAFAIYFHLVNIAEERHRVRVNRLREESAAPDAPRNESFRALAKALAERGHDAKSAAALIKTLRLGLTFTAHPTESRRRTVRHHLASVLRSLDGLDAGITKPEHLEAIVSLLWTTEELRRTRPTVQDEVKGGLEFLPTTLWDALPRVATGLEDAFEERFGERPRLDAPVAFHSWIGGDRDGNPNVTPEVTAFAQTYARERAVRRAIEDVDGLIRDLSAADDRVDVPETITKTVEDAEPLQLPTYFEGESFRRYLMVLRARLRAVIGERTERGYETGEAWRDDLATLCDALESAGLVAAARRIAGPARVRAATYGIDLVKLDLREESSQHAVAVAELLAAGGVTDTYLELSPSEREELLARELKTARPLAAVGFAPATKQLATALASLREWRARGAYVISMTRSVADVLEVFVLAREAGFFRPGKPLPFDVAPLFETLGDLANAPDIVRALLKNDIFRAHALGRGGFEVMIGYSDSNKDAGYLAASWQLAVAQDGITAAARESGVPVFFFHGRGTSTARGGGPAGRAIISLPDGTVGPRIRLTEQGEALADRYEHADLAVRHLEQLLYHFALAADRDARAESPFVMPEEWRSVLSSAAARSEAEYRALLRTPGFFDFFEELTPIREIASLKIASRPVYRHGRVRDVKDLRAIPWVMAWTQVRANLPGWYGAGVALAEMPVSLRRTLWKEWPLFRSILEGAAMSLVTGDLGVTRAYGRLVRPELLATFLPRFEDEWTRTKTLLEETFESELLLGNPTLRRQVELRNPYVDPLNHVQIELLARLRTLPEDHADRPRTERALLTTLLGIAAGVRNVG